MRILRKLGENRFVRNVAIFLSLAGPGIVTGSVDNDAGGITTYSVAGALYGYNLLWTLIPSFVVLLTVQEMNARLGIVTGKGLADTIRENFGVKITFYIFIFFLLADIGNTATEFAGVAGSLGIFGVSKYISVPLSAVAVWLFVVKGNYRIAERIFLVFALFLFSYVISAIMAKPDWRQIGASLVRPRIEWDAPYLSMVLGIVGTTIAPWMQFYMQSSVIEKGLKIDKYRYTQIDVVLGCIATVVVAFFIIVACGSTLHVNNVRIDEAKEAALALRPLAGDLASAVFAFGLFIASVFSAIILPLATAFYVCEAFGFEAGIDKKLREAPQFYGLFTLIMALAVAIILIPGAPLIGITVTTQILNAMLLPVVLTLMMVIAGKKEVMEEYANRPAQKVLGWSITGILIALSGMLIVSRLIGGVRAILRM
jgi:NRAMP (natural resistance-associated macrophage protein)-like metal ion transporter